jgi:hypothetical protein
MRFDFMVNLLVVPNLGTASLMPVFRELEVDFEFKLAPLKYQKTTKGGQLGLIT